MSTAPSTTATPDVSASALVGRQSILTADLKLFGYELLYREAGKNGAQFGDGDAATSTTVLNSFLEIGIDRVVGIHKAFINLTRRFVLDLPDMPVDKDRIVLELLEDLVVDEELITAVKNLAAQGYCLAIDDYAFEPKWEPLLPYVQIIKLDIPAISAVQLTHQLERLRQHKVQLLAEKVETQEEFERLRALGFDLFQGYFFARPKTLTGIRLQENQTILLRLVAQLNDPESTIEELEKLISQDPGLSMKILRFINSAANGLRTPVESIRHAVIFIGLNRIRGWATLLTLSGVSDKPPELLCLGLLRAHFCEQLARLHGEGSADIAYTVGLLSILDAMMDIPMAELLQKLPLPPAISQALTGRENEYGQILDCVLTMEQGKGMGSHHDKYPTELLNSLYISSIEHSIDAMQALS